MIALNFFLLVIACVCFFLAAFGVAAARVNLVALGLALWMLSLLIK